MPAHPPLTVPTFAASGPTGAADRFADAPTGAVVGAHAVGAIAHGAVQDRGMATAHAFGDAIRNAHDDLSQALAAGHCPGMRTAMPDRPFGQGDDAPRWRRR